MKARGETWAGSVSGGRDSAGGNHRLNSANQFCRVFTWTDRRIEREGEKQTHLHNCHFLFRVYCML